MYQIRLGLSVIALFKVSLRKIHSGIINTYKLDCFQLHELGFVMIQ